MSKHKVHTPKTTKLQSQHIKKQRANRIYRSKTTFNDVLNQISNYPHPLSEYFERFWAW